MRTTRPPRVIIPQPIPLNIPSDVSREELLVLVAIHNKSMTTHGHNEGPVHTTTICDECQQEWSFVAYHHLTKLREVHKLVQWNPKTPLDDNQWLAPAVAENMDLVVERLEELNAKAGKPVPDVIGINDEPQEGADDPSGATPAAPAGRSPAADQAPAANPRAGRRRKE